MIVIVTVQGGSLFRALKVLPKRRILARRGGNCKVFQAIQKKSRMFLLRKLSPEEEVPRARAQSRVHAQRPLP